MILSVFERSVLVELLDGEHPILRILRTQLDDAEVSSREFTGVGFFADLSFQPVSESCHTKAGSPSAMFRQLFLAWSMEQAFCCLSITDT
jgi:hypothetical protein